MNPEPPFPDEPWRLENLKTLPWLKAAGWAGLEDDLETALFMRQGLFLRLDSPDPQGHTVLLILVADEVSASDRADVSFVCVGFPPGTFLRDLYPEHDGAPWILLPQCQEPLDASPVGAQHFLRIIEEAGWPEALEAQDEETPFERFQIQDPNHFYGAEPMPGESVEDYEWRLIDGGEDGMGRAFSPDFIRDKKEVWFCRGGGECFGSALCMWAKDMDAIQAAGTSTIAGCGVPLSVLRDAIALLRENVEVAENGKPNWCEPRPYDAAHGRALIRVMTAALKAKPSDEVQSYSDV
jgi:hypothetical protein